MVLVLGLAGCAPPEVTSGINDPHATRNREVHAFNKSVDSALLGPGSDAYGSILPEPVRLTVSNLGSNLDLPRVVVNNILQGKIDDTVHNTFRFLINSTFGLAGLLDPATDMGLTLRDTDFGETLHVWGAPEGAYQELPLVGPSTERDTVGRIVDIGLNPLRFALPENERSAASALTIASRIGDRYQFSGTVESILYDSADSYAQSRLLYLQNRRFELGGESGQEFADPYDDPYYDPYEDPDVQ